MFSYKCTNCFMKIRVTLQTTVTSFLLLATFLLCNFINAWKQSSKQKQTISKEIWASVIFKN